MVSVYGIDPETAGNNPDIEKQWAVKSWHHAETYMKLLEAVGPERLKITPIDEVIYQEFRKEFPELRVDELQELTDFKCDAAKAKWRPWIMSFEKRIDDYNFGTLLRIKSSGDYTEENTMFVTRTQFMAIELARNREGHNKNIQRAE